MQKKVNKIRILLILVLVGSLSIVGCDKKKETPSPKQPQVKKPLEPQPPIQHQESTVKAFTDHGSRISFGDQKDPFKPLIVVSKKAPAAKKNRFGQVIPILNYEVSQFKVTGIIVGMKENSAMVLDPTGKPYILKAGMEIGRNEGRVTKIAPNYIEVFEQYRDESGKPVKKTIRLTLPKKE